jgi:hypothetical protein
LAISTGGSGQIITTTADKDYAYYSSKRQDTPGDTSLVEKSCSNLLYDVLMACASLFSDIVASISL